MYYISSFNEKWILNQLKKESVIYMSNQKERILDLMRKGIITENEAIELLEKSGLSGDAGQETYEGDETSQARDKDGYQTDSSEAFKQFMNQAGSFMKNMLHSAKKSVNDNVDFSNGFPSLKYLSKSDFKAFEGPISNLTVTATTGDVTVKTKDVKKTIVEVSYKVYGGISEALLDEFIQDNVSIELQQDELLVAVKSKRIVVDVTITLPLNALKTAKLDVVNGTMILEELTADELKIKKVNGDLTIQRCHLGALYVKSVNGEVRVVANFETADITNVNGEILVTTTSLDGENLKVKNVNGDVKISVPENIGLVGYIKTTFGSYKTRVELDTPLEITKNGAALVRKAVNSLTLDISTNTGSIWLKDGLAVEPQPATPVAENDVTDTVNTTEDKAEKSDESDEAEKSDHNVQSDA